MLRGSALTIASTSLTSLVNQRAVSVRGEQEGLGKSGGQAGLSLS
jgi:hypothetical protein